MSRKNIPHKLPGGRTIWEHRAVATVAALVAILDGDFFILLCQRGPGCPDEIGKWCMPCGYLDFDETLEQCAAREVWEETGLDVNDGNWKMDPDPWRINSNPSDGKQNVSISYLFMANKVLEALPVPNSKNSEPDEVSNYQWAKLSTVPLRTDMAFNHNKTIEVLCKNILGEDFVQN